MSRCSLLSHLLVISTVSVKEKVKVTNAFSLKWPIRLGQVVRKPVDVNPGLNVN